MNMGPRAIERFDNGLFDTAIGDDNAGFAALAKSCQCQQLAFDAAFNTGFALL